MSDTPPANNRICISPVVSDTGTTLLLLIAAGIVTCYLVTIYLVILYRVTLYLVSLGFIEISAGGIREPAPAPLELEGDGVKLWRNM